MCVYMYMMSAIGRPATSTGLTPSGLKVKYIYVHIHVCVCMYIYYIYICNDIDI